MIQKVYDLSRIVTDHEPALRKLAQERFARGETASPDVITQKEETLVFHPDGTVSVQ